MDGKLSHLFLAVVFTVLCEVPKTCFLRVDPLLLLMLSIKLASGSVLKRGVIIIIHSAVLFLLKGKHISFQHG